jgi:hydrogenase expression/formation protein HypC
MCLGIPARVVEIDGESAVVEVGGAKNTVNITLIEDVSPGEYVVVHAGFAIEKIDEDAALFMLRAMEGLK